jgi:hypothetical protein
LDKQKASPRLNVLPPSSVLNDIEISSLGYYFDPHFPSYQIEEHREETARMSCTACTSERQAEFGVEMNIHFPGREGLGKPAVWVFPKVLVCLDCGFTEFSIPKTELALLAGGYAEK